MARNIFSDSTIVRAHQHAAGALKKTVGKPHKLWDVLAGDFPRKSMRAVEMKRQESLSFSQVENGMICQDLIWCVIRSRQRIILKMR
jgi:hypothetical protein